MDLDRHHVLIVEDEILIGMDLADIVRDAGAEVVGPALSIGQALRLIDTQCITVAILDVQLGKANSDEVAFRLEISNIPFIFHTGARDKKLWPTHWPHAPLLSKPATPVEIIAALAKAGKLPAQSF